MIAIVLFICLSVLQAQDNISIDLLEKRVQETFSTNEEEKKELLDLVNQIKKMNHTIEAVKQRKAERQRTYQFIGEAMLSPCGKKLEGKKEL